MQALFLTLLISLCSALRIQVAQPDGLNMSAGDTNVSVHEHVMGPITWGSSFYGQLYYSASLAQACSAGEVREHVPPNRILLVEKTNCSYYLRSLLGQTLHAKMILEIYKDPGDIHDKIIFDHLTGGSYGITVPFAVIGLEDGNILRGALQANTNVSLRVHFNRVRSEKVNVSFWMSVCDQQSYAFLKDFKTYHDKLGGKIDFTPHYWMYYENIEGGTASDYDNKFCIHGGKYCMVCYLDHDDSIDYDHRPYLQEIVRQKCVFMTQRPLWWKYAIEFGDNCFNHTSMEAMTDCSLDVMQRVGMGVNDIFNILDCYNASFKGEDFHKSENKILSKEMFTVTRHGMAFSVPSIKINNVNYEPEKLESNGVLKEVCSSLKGYVGLCDRKPEIEDTSLWWLYPSIILMVLLTIVISFYFFRRALRRDATDNMDTQIKEAVSKYFSMKDKPENKQ